MKRFSTFVLMLLLLLCCVSCDMNKNNQTKPDDDEKKVTSQNSDGSEFPRFTGLDEETEGEQSIIKWAQNCSLAYRFSRLKEGEEDFTVWSDAVQLCCLDNFYYRGYTDEGYDRWREGNPDYNVPDEHYGIIIDGDSVTVYDFYLKIRATGETWDEATCWGFTMESVANPLLYASVHQDSWLHHYDSDKYTDNRIVELEERNIAGRDCKGIHESTVLHTEAYGDNEISQKTIYYDPQTGLGMDCIDHQLDTAFVFEKIEFNCVTPDDVKAVIEEQKKGIVFTDMTLDEYRALKSGE